MIGIEGLKRHPFPIATHFSHSLVLAYAIDPVAVQHLLPPGLTLDLYVHPDTKQEYAFVVAALVQTDHLRLAGLPKWMGGNFFLTGYRLFVRRRHEDGRLLRGLFVLRSDTDKRSMVFGGNLSTHYDYHLASLRTEVTSDRFSVAVEGGDGLTDLDVTADLTSRPAPLPNGSPFARVEDARRFAGPLPWTFNYEKKTDSIIMVRGRRGTWNPERVSVEVRKCNYIEQPHLAAGRPTLANAFYVHDIDYGWDKGIRVPARQLLPNDDDIEAVDE